jgi:hypothetical protein
MNKQEYAIQDIIEIKCLGANPVILYLLEASICFEKTRLIASAAVISTSDIRNFASENKASSSKTVI